MKYTSTFQIDCGVTHGFGIKYPENYERLDFIESETEIEAFKGAYQIATHHARDHLSNPNTDFTTVTLKSLRDSTGKLIPQEPLASKLGILLREGQIFVQCSLLEHLLDLVKDK